MQASNVPGKIQKPFADDGDKQTIPVASQIGVTDGRASYTDGFPPLTRTPIVAGGVPPFGTDMNGILNAITAIQKWQSAGGQFTFDAAFAAAIGGYPKGATLQKADGSGTWLCITDNNSTNPDTGGAGWQDFSAGRLLNVQIFTASGTYTPTAGTKSVVVEAVGAGGGSGGAPATNASQSGLSAPGSNGAYAKARYLSGFSGVTVTVGAGGSAGGPTTAGGNGGTTSFGALLSCPGGRGAGTGVLVGATPVISLGGSGSGSPTGSGILQAIGSFASNNALGASWGNATGFLPLRTTPIGAGLGGSGVYTGASTSAVNGNTGENGCVIVWEYA